MDKICVVIVVYNTLINQIRSWALFEKYHHERNLSIVIVDNSNDANVIKKNKDLYLTLYREIVFISNENNLGLSKSYNIAVNSVDAEWYFFADDDTLFSNEYIDAALKMIKNQDGCSFCGIIKSNNKPFSPAFNMPLFSGNIRFVEQPGIYENLYVVNSGMILSKETIEKCNYFDERLFVDLVDYNLMEQLKRKHINKFCVLDGYISQDFSGNNIYGIKESMPRFKIFARDARMFCKLNKKSFLYGEVMILKRFMSIVIGSIKKDRE